VPRLRLEWTSTSVRHAGKLDGIIFGGRRPTCLPFRRNMFTLASDPKNRMS
jgi:hypothetical protein